MRGDGDGWSWSPDGSKHWGKHGAAGLLLRAPLADGRPAVLLQHRAFWSHQGGTWALPGGARDSHETTVHAAVREAEEEAGISGSSLRVRTERVTHRVAGGWTYTTVVADAAEPLTTVRNRESAELRWVPEDEVDSLPLHPGFAASWPLLKTVRLQLMIDGVSDIDALTAALPRTIELPDAGFGWLPPVGSAVDAPDGTTVLIGDEAASAPVGGFAIAFADVVP